VRLGGYRPIAVPVDAEGMTVAGLQALDAGVRAVAAHPALRTPRGRASARACGGAARPPTARSSS
jgi:hypothetical protein